MPTPRVYNMLKEGGVEEQIVLLMTVTARGQVGLLQDKYPNSE